MKNSGIYKIENKLNGKMYVGLTNNIDRRWGEHRKNLRQGKHVNTHLQSAVDKYGIENFTFDIIEQCCVSDLVKRELYWIEYHNTNDNRFGYNIERKTPYPTSNAKKESTREYVKIYQIDKDNQIVKVWNSVKEVSEFYNISQEIFSKKLYGRKLDSDRIRKRWKEFVWVSENKYDSTFDYFEKMTWEPGTRFTVSRVKNPLGEIIQKLDVSEGASYFNTTEGAFMKASCVDEVWKGIKVIRESDYNEAKDYSFSLLTPKYTKVLYKIQNTITQEIVEISNISQAARDLGIKLGKLLMLLKGERKENGKVRVVTRYKEWIKIPL